MVNQLDLYAGIHKGHRGALFGMSARAGRLDVSNPGSVDSLYTDLVSFRDALHFHIDSEEKFIHPLLSDRVPAGARTLEEEHREHNQRVDDLVAHLEGLRAKPADFEKRRELALEFYRALNRFISTYLVHIDKEEEEIQPTLWKLCMDDELRAAFAKILAHQSPKDVMQNLSMMIPAMSLDEVANLYAGAKVTVPPQAVQVFTSLAERLLSPDDWAVLKQRFAKI